MKMSEKCRNNNSDNPLTSRRTDGGKKTWIFPTQKQFSSTNILYGRSIQIVKLLSVGFGPFSSTLMDGGYYFWCRSPGAMIVKMKCMISRSFSLLQYVIHLKLF